MPFSAKHVSSRRTYPAVALLRSSSADLRWRISDIARTEHKQLKAGRRVSLELEARELQELENWTVVQHFRNRGTAGKIIWNYDDFRRSGG